jgi:hypothetical protein
MKNIDIKIIEKHDNILNIIREPIECLANFDWHSDYPRYGMEIIDVDQYYLQMDPAFYEAAWVAVLASFGRVKEFTWIFPHDHDIEDIKVFESKGGDSIIFNKKFDPSMEINCPIITLDMDFFGSRTPINWNPGKGRMTMFRELLGTLKANNITLIICKSDQYVNYDNDKFLQEMLTELLCDKKNR